MASRGAANALTDIFSHDRRFQHCIDKKAMQLVRTLRAVLKSENQPLSLHWVAFFYRRRRDGGGINLRGERTSLKAAIELWMLDMDFDELGSGFLWNPRDTATYRGILVKLTKKHREGSAHFNWGCYAALWTRTSRSELVIFIKGCIYLGTTFVNRICWWKDCRLWRYIRETHQQGIWWSRIEENKVARPERRVEEGIEIPDSRICDLTELDISLGIKGTLDGTWMQWWFRSRKLHMIPSPFRSLNKGHMNHSSSPTQ